MCILWSMAKEGWTLIGIWRRKLSCSGGVCICVIRMVTSGDPSAPLSDNVTICILCEYLVALGSASSLRKYTASFIYTDTGIAPVTTWVKQSQPTQSAI